MPIFWDIKIINFTFGTNGFFFFAGGGGGGVQILKHIIVFHFQNYCNYLGFRGFRIFFLTLHCKSVLVFFCMNLPVLSHP